MDRNTRPRSPGDYTGRIFRENALKAAEKKAAEQRAKNDAELRTYEFEDDEPIDFTTMGHKHEQ